MHRPLQNYRLKQVPRLKSFLTLDSFYFLLLFVSTYLYCIHCAKYLNLITTTYNVICHLFDTYLPNFWKLLKYQQLKKGIYSMFWRLYSDFVISHIGDPKIIKIWSVVLARHYSSSFGYSKHLGYLYPNEGVSYWIVLILNHVSYWIVLILWKL